MQRRRSVSRPARTSLNHKPEALRAVEPRALGAPLCSSRACGRPCRQCKLIPTRAISDSTIWGRSQGPNRNSSQLAGRAQKPRAAAG